MNINNNIITVPSPSPCIIEEIETITIEEQENVHNANTSNSLSVSNIQAAASSDMFSQFRSNTEHLDDDPKGIIIEDDELSSSTSYLSESDSDQSFVEILPPPDAPKKGVKLKSSVNKKELDLSDLPPIEDLHIKVPEEKCVPVGKILNIVDTLVLIKANPNTPTLDLDSVLFLDKGNRSLGKIFDVIGPVVGPVYCVRFNSNKHIQDSNIQVNQDVYCAPQTDYTSYVPLPNLLNSKGSDASWEKDREPPPEVLEFSDDEEEQRQKRVKANRNRNNQEKLSRDTDCEPRPKRPTPFEQKMNLRNLLITASYERSSQSTSEPSTHKSPPSKGKQIIKAPTLPDVPHHLLPQPRPCSTNTMSPHQAPCASSHEVIPMPHFVSTNLAAPIPPQHNINNPQMGPGPFNRPPVYSQFFQPNKIYTNNRSPFANVPRFGSPFPPPTFTLPPPMPILNDMFMFGQRPPEPPRPPNTGPMVPPFPRLPPPPPPSIGTPQMPLPFQFGMPPLIGPQNLPHFHPNAPSPRPNMRPAFNSHVRF